MKKILTVLFLTTSCFVVNAQFAREQQPNSAVNEAFDAIPTTKLISVSKDTLISGTVLSVCSGYTMKSGKVYGVVKLQSGKNATMIYSVISDPDEKIIYTKGQAGSINVGPLPDNEQYYLIQRTCTSVSEDILVIKKDIPFIQKVKNLKPKRDK